MLISVKIIRTQSIIQAESNFSYITKECVQHLPQLISYDVLHNRAVSDFFAFTYIVCKVYKQKPHPTDKKPRNANECMG